MTTIDPNLTLGPAKGILAIAAFCLIWLRARVLILKLRAWDQRRIEQRATELINSWADQPSNVIRLPARQTGGSDDRRQKPHRVHQHALRRGCQSPPVRDDGP